MYFFFTRESKTLFVEYVTLDAVQPIRHILSHNVANKAQKVIVLLNNKTVDIMMMI